MYILYCIPVSALLNVQRTFPTVPIVLQVAADGRREGEASISPHFAGQCEVIVRQLQYTPNGAKVVKRMMQAFLGFCGAPPSPGPHRYVHVFLSRRASFL